jgi:asparagine synthase (glutamine-hydrolysing)
MCGINGILRLREEAPPPERDELLRTREAMRSRGPDGDGLWISERGDLGLAHRRLAIIDLSDAGLQPMVWGTNDRFRLVFNGEIYNYRELRRDLVAAGVRFRSHCDSEVILALYEREGPAMLSRLRGMYALALWDAAERRLLLARDPYGIKPLYYAEAGGSLRFASQVKALEAGGALPGDVDTTALVGFLLWGSVPEPATIRRAVRALPAGHHIVVENGRVGAPRAHYDFGPVEADAAADPARALEQSVRAHLVSDVPVAVFLSAGLDSSLIAALACRALVEPPTTLTLQFDEYRGTPLDEAPFAAAVARRLGTRHVERSVARRDFLDLWPAALAAMDQPSIDGFNTYVVSSVAHAEGIKVVLSGLGGDELLGSYHSFADVPRWRRWARRLRRVPGLGAAWPRLAVALRPDKPKLGGMLRFGPSLAGSYFLRRSLFQPHELPALVGAAAAREGLERYDPVADAAKLLDALAATAHPALRSEPALEWQAVHAMESTLYMRNQLLRDSDWASMAHSLELRVPLVDAWLRREIAAAGFEPARSHGKAEAIRRAAPELPAELWGRPKSGFSIPVMSWLDEEVGIDTAPGLASRRLALEVLKAFGIELERAEPRNAAIA